MSQKVRQVTTKAKVEAIRMLIPREEREEIERLLQLPTKQEMKEFVLTMSRKAKISFLLLLRVADDEMIPGFDVAV